MSLVLFLKIGDQRFECYIWTDERKTGRITRVLPEIVHSKYFKRKIIAKSGG